MYKRQPSDLVLRVEQWWEEMGTRANESTPGLGLRLLEENYAARMWDDLSQKGYNSQQGVPLSGETQLAGDPFRGRRLLEPQQIRERMGGIIGKIQRGERLQAWEAAYRDDAARIIRAAQSEKKRCA